MAVTVLVSNNLPRRRNSLSEETSEVLCGRVVSRDPVPFQGEDDGHWIRNHLPDTVFLATRETGITVRMVLTNLLSSSCSLQFCHPTGVPAPSVPLKGWHVLSRREDEFLVQVWSLPRRNGYRKNFFLSPLNMLFCA